MNGKWPARTRHNIPDICRRALLLEIEGIVSLANAESVSPEER